MIIAYMAWKHDTPFTRGLPPVYAIDCYPAHYFDGDTHRTLSECIWIVPGTVMP